MSRELNFKFAIFGHIRELEDKYKIVVPNEIKTLILKYYPKKINYIGKFLKDNASGCISIKSDQLSFEGYRSAKLDQSLPTSLEFENISMIYRWRAVNLARHSGFPTAVIFGVVSNRCTKFHAYPDPSLVGGDQTLKDAYGISMRSGVVFHGDIEDDNDYAGFKRSHINPRKLGNQCRRRCC